MPLIFDDILDVTEGEGTYTLQVDSNGTWQNLHSIQGPANGQVYVNSTLNTIKLDTSVLLSGNSYNFRWVDGAGLTSNVHTLLVDGSITLSGSVGTDADGFPQFLLNLNVVGGSGTYNLHMNNGAFTQTMQFTSAMIENHGVSDPQNFTSPITLPIRGSDYGRTFSFYIADSASSLSSQIVYVTQPSLNTDPTKTINLVVNSSSSNIQLTGSIAGNTSGKYRLEIRDSTNNPIHDKDFSDVSFGSITASFTYSELNVTAGQTYSFLLFDTEQVVSNTVTLPV